MYRPLFQTESVTNLLNAFRKYPYFGSSALSSLGVRELFTLTLIDDC